MEWATGQRYPLRGPFFADPVWSPEGRRVAYVGWVEGHPCWGKDELYRADPLCRWRGVGVYVETVGDGMPQLIARNAVDPA